VSTFLSSLFAPNLAIQFLPEGFWPVPPRNGTGATGVVSGGSVYTLSRFEFLRSIGGQSVVNTVRFWSSNGRTYKAFILNGGQTGRPLALLDADHTQNALYVFDADNPSWIRDAQRSKYQVLNGSYPSFLQRIYHSGDWRKRVIDFVANY